MLKKIPGKNFLIEIKLVAKSLSYNTKIDEIIKKHNPPKSYESGDNSGFEKKWRPVLDDLISFAKEMQLPTYHLYGNYEHPNSKNVKELVRGMREYAQTRFGQLISLFAICFSFLSVVVSIVALIVASVSKY